MTSLSLSLRLVVTRFAAAALCGLLVSPAATARQMATGESRPPDPCADFRQADPVIPSLVPRAQPNAIDFGEVPANPSRQIDLPDPVGSDFHCLQPIPPLRFDPPPSGPAPVHGLWLVAVLISAMARTLGRECAAAQADNEAGRRAYESGSASGPATAQRSGRRPVNPRGRDANRSGSAAAEAQAGAPGGDRAPDGSAATADRIPVPDSWERGPGATFRGGRNGLWLHFHRDAELAYTNDNSIPPRDARPDIGPVILQVRAGQQVRVVDSRAPDDGLGHEPTVRADFAEVRVSALGAAVQVYVLPPSDAMQRVYKRSADDLAFWKAMLAAPEDDLPRMVYADWLDERGDPAGPILRGAVPLTMYYSVSIGDRWEPRQVRPADWRVAVTELRTFVSQGGVYFLEDPGYARIALSQYTRTPQSAGRDAWHCMSVSLASGEPLPPFVNYLLVQTAFAEWIRLFHAPGRRPDAGEQPRLEIPDPTTDRRPAADEPAAPPPPAVGQIWLVGTTLWLVRSVNPAAGTAWVGFLDDLAPIDPNRREAVINYIAEHPQQHAATRTVSTRFLTDHCRMVAHWPAGVMIQLGYAPL